jgi:hypothetical protein
MAQTVRKLEDAARIQSRMMMAGRWMIPLLIPTFLASACSSESSESKPGPGTCPGLASEVCGALARCGGAAFELQFASEADCNNQFSRLCELETGAPGSGMGAEYLAACGAAYGESCDDLRYGQIAECETPKGSLPDGSGCAFDSQCASGFCFEPFANGGCGWCFTQITVGEGEACGGYDPTTGAPIECGSGLECEDSLSGVGSICVVPGALGAACGGETQRCNEGLVCKNSKCEKGGQAGATCTSVGDCDLFGSFTCNPLTNQCQPLEIADGGQPCGLIEGTVTLCRENADCVGLSPVQTQGTCALLIPEGQACEYGDGCQGLSQCTATTPDNPGTCSEPDPSACHSLDGGA